MNNWTNNHLLVSAPHRSQVCKGWRALRSDPALWHSLELSCEHLGRGSLRRARAEITFNEMTLRAFLFSPARSPLFSSCGAVRDLTVHGGTKECGTSAFKAIFKAFTGVTRLTLSGRKITPPALTDLSRALGPTLLHLNLSRLATAGGPDALLALLSACPRLESLSLPGGESCADSPGFLRALGHRVGAARAAGAAGGAAGPAGGSSLLRALIVGDPNGQPDVTCDGWLSAAALPSLGGAFPELETLRLFGLQSTAQPFEVSGSWLYGGCKEGGAPDPRGRKRPDVAALRKQWAPLPRLRRRRRSGRSTADTCAVPPVFLSHLLLLFGRVAWSYCCLLQPPMLAPQLMTLVAVPRAS